MQASDHARWLALGPSLRHRRQSNLPRLMQSAAGVETPDGRSGQLRKIHLERHPAVHDAVPSSVHSSLLSSASTSLHSPRTLVGRYSGFSHLDKRHCGDFPLAALIGTLKRCTAHPGWLSLQYLDTSKIPCFTELSVTPTITLASHPRSTAYLKSPFSPPTSSLHLT